MPSKLDLEESVKPTSFKRYPTSLGFDGANKIMAFDFDDLHTRLHAMLDE